MSTKLEQILELLLAEENEKAEEMLHEYVVDKARSQYESLLDEEVEEDVEVDEAAEVDEAEEELDETEEVDEVIDQSNDFEDDVLANEEEIEADEIGEEDEDEDAMPMDEPMGDDEGEEDLEDKVDELADELEALKAEFDALMADEAGEEMGDEEEAEMDADAEEMDLESVEYDLDEDADDDVVAEATKLSNAVAAPKGGAGDAEGESPFTKAPKKTNVQGAGSPVKAKDGGEGAKGDKAKDHTPTNNIKVEPKKV